MIFVYTVMAISYLSTEEGIAKVYVMYTSMMQDTSNSDQTVIANLTQDQITTICNGVLSSLTEEQKETIKQGIIEQKISEQMVLDDVQSQITDAVQQVSEEAGAIATLKSTLDQYTVFYQGVKEYTEALNNIKNGISTLSDNLATLRTNVTTLFNGATQLNDAMKHYMMVLLA